MPKFAASLSWLFQEVPLLQRFQSAADAGFQAVEVQAPYEVSAKALAEQLERHNLTAVLINMQPGLAAIPGSQSEFRKSLDRALAYADTMHCQQLHCLSGITDNPRAEETLVSNLRWASEQASQHGVRLLLEPLNTTDNPGYFLTGTNQARRIIEAVDSPYVAMQFDAYHLQIMEGSLTESLRKHFDIIAHIQIGGVPGRHSQTTDKRSTTPTFSTSSTNSDSRAGSAVNTLQSQEPTDWIGPSPTALAQQTPEEKAHHHR